MKVKSEREVAQSCPTPSDPMDCSLPVSSVHGIYQARVLEWGAIAFSKWSLISNKLLGRNLKRNLDAKQGAKGEMEWGPTMTLFLNPSPSGILEETLSVQKNTDSK